MRATKRKFEEVTKLPDNALSVANYAKESGYSVTYIYTKVANGTADYKIVQFQGYNFVIPA